METSSSNAGPSGTPSTEENPVTQEIEPPCRDINKTVKEGSNSTLEVSTDENQRWIGKKLLFYSSKEIGKSGNGTVVFEGSYEGRPVAVKRLLQSHLKVDYDEIKLLKNSHHHQNIVRYHGDECDLDFVYLAMERCDCSLDDFIQTCSADFSSEYVFVEKNSDDLIKKCSADFSSEYEVLETASNNGDDKSVTVYKNDPLEKLKNKLGDVKLRKENGRPSSLLLKLMRDMVSGLVHLHGLNIIHRDLKPQNVLITKRSPTFIAKLSDMGISRRLLENKSTLSNHNTDCGTKGWTAPEKLLRGRQKRSMDMFSLGCILFYCITFGSHPFGSHDERDRNIKSDKKQNLHLIQAFPEAFRLIPSLLEADHEKRPNATEVLHDPLFWDSEKRLSFLCDASDRVGENSELCKALEGTARTVFGYGWIWLGKSSWDKKVDDKIIKHMSQNEKRAYNYTSVRDLLLLIRDMLNDYKQLPKDIEELVGPGYERFDDYFRIQFPMLFIEVYEVVYNSCKEEDYFGKYFKGICG